jgi:hypothetical protein
MGKLPSLARTKLPRTLLSYVVITAANVKSCLHLTNAMGVAIFATCED